MGKNLGQNRQRMSSHQNPGDPTNYALGVSNIELEKYDEEVIADQINAKLDSQEAKIKEKTQYFVR